MRFLDKISQRGVDKITIFVEKLNDKMFVCDIYGHYFFRGGKIRRVSMSIRYANCLLHLRPYFSTGLIFIGK